MIEFLEWIIHYPIMLLSMGWYGFLCLAFVSSPFLILLHRWNQRRRAIRSAKSKLENPQNAEAAFHLAELYARGGSWRRAEDAMDEAIRRVRLNPVYEGRIPFHFFRLLGDILYHRKKFTAALETYRLALGESSISGHADVRLGMGKAHYKLGEPDRALEIFQESLKDTSSNLEAHFRRAQAAAALGQAEELAAARNEYRRVISALPRFATKRQYRWRLAFAFFPIARRIV